MRFVHYGHACVLVETEKARLLFDPGAFSTGYAGLTDLDAVLITHEHFDHLDTEALPALLEANPRAQLVVDAGAAKLVEGLEFTVARPGAELTLGGAQVRAIGGQHAIIHEDIPVISNTGFLVEDGGFYHPGDSLFVPPQDIDVLGVPISGPWLKTSEAIGFARVAKPRVAVPIHEAVHANPAMFHGMIGNLLPEKTTFTVLEQGQSTAL
ncbi:MBL fold metallo-hydrolase [Sciscionella sediminilitoris]|uniref:MBL fold metallo-hydrolase n=1 Tax=Sciscionella sediminilitoris TaxID=1445613 RepID=UPI0004DFA843|nr:MBL fold metallo-hydrolase [Sciscionella sp. SE31]